MGITGLLPYVKKASRPVHVREISGSTVGIDAYSWLHKGAFGCAEQLVRGQPTSGYVTYTMKYLDMLLAHSIKPVLVFDGRNLPSKEGTERTRRERRKKYRKLAQDYLREGRIREARECYQRCIDITPDMARDVIRACQERNIDCVVAPYEADAQLARLDMDGLIDYVITEDSDLTLFGCRQIVFKLDLNGNGVLYRRDQLHLCLGQKSTAFNFDKFRHMCIMSGCDYLASLPGIGLGKSAKFWARVSNPNLRQVLPKIPAYLNMSNVTVTPEYVDGFLRADRTFLHQLVYDVRRRRLCPLQDYEEDGEPVGDMSYAGERLDEDVALQMALGNVDLRTLENVNDFDPDRPRTKPAEKPQFGYWSDHDSIWSRDYDPKRSEEARQRLEEERSTVHTAFGDIKKAGSSSLANDKSSRPSDTSTPVKNKSQATTGRGKRKSDVLQHVEDAGDDQVELVTHYAAKKPKVEEEDNSVAQQAATRTKFVSKYFNKKTPETSASTKDGQETEVKDKKTTEKTSADSWFEQLDAAPSAPQTKFIYRTDLDESTKENASDDDKDRPRSSSVPKIGLEKIEDVPLKSNPACRQAFKPVVLAGDNVKGDDGTGSPTNSGTEDKDEAARKRRNPFAKKLVSPEQERKTKEEENKVTAEEDTSRPDEATADSQGSSVESSFSSSSQQLASSQLSQLSAFSIDNESFHFSPKITVDEGDADDPVEEEEIAQVASSSSSQPIAESKYFSTAKATFSSQQGRASRPRGLSGLLKKRSTATPGKQRSLLDLWGKK